ncbi:MAG: carbon-phosphorus lyase complex subunit PhnI [Chloroflexi bacterium]|nr:carbon-phosphorus lyase complex subunit PhnI [Chloroflexota bacterium]
MGYVAARGGHEAIHAAEELVRRKRAEGNSPWLEVEQVTDRLRLAVDRVMGEGGLWAPELAARALRQAEGDVIEASQLVRSHRSTLPRLAVSCTASTDEMRVLRRIVPAYRTPPGPQLLGRTLDYVGRLLDNTPEDQLRTASTEAAIARTEASETGGHDPGSDDARRIPKRLYELLRDKHLLVERRRPPGDDPEPYDITTQPVRPGVPRSARLAVMARAETGALVNLWYRNILGPDQHLHEVTLGEVRHGHLPVRVRHPRTGGAVTVGELRVTEVEAIEDIDGTDEDRTRFDVGYGLCLGHNERKAIAMANLDVAAERDRGRSPLEQSILLTTDGLDASGFLEHLKLPHYVTFRSMVERKQAVRAAATTVDPLPPDCR